MARRTTDDTAAPSRPRTTRPTPAEARGPDTAQRDSAAGDTPVLRDIPALQRSIGNAAVARLVGGAGDTETLGGETAPVQRSTVPDVLRGAGTPMAEPLRAEMETRLGADFTDVRLHTGTTAQRSAAEIGARAYTAGSHVVLGESGVDKHVIAHELTHVLQQREGAVAGTDNGDGLRVSDPSDRFERAAEDNATRVMRSAVPTDTHDHDHDQHGTHAGTDVQRYTTETNDREAEVLVSENGAYAITSGADHIWVRDGATTGQLSPAMQPDKRRPTTMVVGEATYTRHRLAKTKVIEDCLHAAEEIINNKVAGLAYGEAEYSQIEVAAGRENFGQSYEKNEEQAKAFAPARDLDASPQAGEAFVTVATAPGKRKMSQYHAAAVVARDGQDCVTLEVFATAAEIPTTGPPSARIYTVGDPGLSFHGHWEEAYFRGTGPITVIIQSHPDHRA